jgi:glucosamine--fructose-6-phosphate aminotransferase (isomerizing)
VKTPISSKLRDIFALWQREGNVTDDVEVIEGRYFQDILGQPGALENTLNGLEVTKPLRDLAQRLNHGKFQRIVLTGMGSSFHALHPLQLKLVDHGFTSLMLETSELVHYQKRFCDPSTLIVAVSQSGQSAEMVRLLEINRKRSAVIAVTNTKDSPLAKHATGTLFTHAGAEYSVSCKTYVTSLMALKYLGDFLCERDLRRSQRELRKAAPAVAEYLADWRNHVRTFAMKLRNVPTLFLAGRGASLAAVGTGALIVKESDHFPTEGMTSAAFRHGPVEMLGPETFVLVFEGDAQTRDLNERLVGDIQRLGGRAELVGENAPLKCCRLAEHGASVRPILEILPVHMVTIALAAIRAREAGRFVVATKVTTTE